MSAVSKLSLSRTGTPCSGPRAPLVRRSASSACASMTAFGFSRITALIAGPCLSYAAMRARYMFTSCSDVIVPEFRAASVSLMVASIKRNGTTGVATPATVPWPWATSGSVNAAASAATPAAMVRLRIRTRAAGGASLLESIAHPFVKNTRFFVRRLYLQSVGAGRSLSGRR
jgi:hypothetical protein